MVSGLAALFTDARRTICPRISPCPLRMPPANEQVDGVLKKQQEKEKKMWSKAFS